MNDQTIYKQKYFFCGFWYSGFHWFYFIFFKNVVRQHIFEMRKENLLLPSLSLWCLLCQVQCVIYLPFMKNDRDDFQRNFMNLMKLAWLYIICYFPNFVGTLEYCLYIENSQNWYAFLDDILKKRESFIAYCLFSHSVPLDSKCSIFWGSSPIIVMECHYHKGPRDHLF